MRLGTICNAAVFLFIILGCSNQKMNAEEKIYKFLEDNDYKDFANSKDCITFTVNSGTKEDLRTIEVDSVEYNILIENGELKIIRTCDDNFKTSDGYSKKTNVSKLLRNGNRSLYVEQGVYVFIPLSNNWRAVVHDETELYSIEDKNSRMQITGFLKVDPSLSIVSTMEDWKNEMAKSILME